MPVIRWNVISIRGNKSCRVLLPYFVIWECLGLILVADGTKRGTKRRGIIPRLTIFRPMSAGFCIVGKSFWRAGISIRYEVDTFTSRIFPHLILGDIFILWPRKSNHVIRILSNRRCITMIQWTGQKRYLYWMGPGNKVTGYSFPCLSWVPWPGWYEVNPGQGGSWLDGWEIFRLTFYIVNAFWWTEITMRLTYVKDLGYREQGAGKLAYPHIYHRQSTYIHTCCILHLLSYLYIWLCWYKL